MDFGTGSGVAAIAVAKAGARRVTACDMDQDAIDAARANWNSRVEPRRLLAL